MSDTNNKAEMTTSQDGTPAGTAQLGGLTVRVASKAIAPAETRAAFNRPPRTDALENVTFVSRGGAKLQRPDTKILSEIQAADPRVRIFSVVDSEAFQIDNSPVIDEPAMSRLITTPLAAQIARDFPGRNLEIRGIKTSINGAVEADGMTVLDIQDTLAAGEEQLAGRMLTAPFRPDSEHPPKLHTHVNHAVNGTDLFRFDADDGTGSSEAIFPAVLVYDPDQLVLGSYYSAHLRYPDRTNEAILAAYVLDCPVNDLF